jgi:hypothetical protein
MHHETIHLLENRRDDTARCPFHKSYASALPLETPGSSPASEATLERGAPRKNFTGYNGFCLRGVTLIQGCGFVSKDAIGVLQVRLRRRLCNRCP